MSNLKLNDYSDKEIVKAIMTLPASKFMTVINAIGAINERMVKRGKFIATENGDEIIENIISQLLESDEL